MSSSRSYMPRPAYYPEELQRRLDSKLQRSLSETSMDRNSYGVTSGATEESLKELFQTTQPPKESNISHQSENEMIVKAVRWATKSVAAVVDAGGVPAVIDQIPEELLQTLVRNSLVLKYEKS